MAEQQSKQWECLNIWSLGAISTLCFYAGNSDCGHTLCVICRICKRGNKQKKVVCFRQHYPCNLFCDPSYELHIYLRIPDWIWLQCLFLLVHLLRAFGSGNDCLVLHLNFWTLRKCIESSGRRNQKKPQRTQTVQRSTKRHWMRRTKSGYAPWIIKWNFPYVHVQLVTQTLYPVNVWRGVWTKLTQSKKFIGNWSLRRGARWIRLIESN